jgi:hypothetical protein
MAPLICRILDLPSRINADLAQLIVAAQLVRGGVLHALADRQAQDQDEAADGDAQCGQRRAHFLLPQGRQG